MYTFTRHNQSLRMAPLVPPGQALVRARELCLLGDYEQGMREFQSVMKDLKRQCAFSAAPEVRQVSHWRRLSDAP